MYIVFGGGGGGGGSYRVKIPLIKTKKSLKLTFIKALYVITNKIQKEYTFDKLWCLLLSDIVSARFDSTFSVKRSESEFTKKQLSSIWSCSQSFGMLLYQASQSQISNLKLLCGKHNTLYDS